MVAATPQRIQRKHVDLDGGGRVIVSLYSVDLFTMTERDMDLVTGIGELLRRHETRTAGSGQAASPGETT